jgi:ABC-type branched-subunit amino acid transport system substrate-binding protein
MPRASTEASVPFGAPDLTPAIAKLAEAKVQCVALSVEPQVVAQAMIAIQQDGLKAKVAGIGAVITNQVISSLGKRADGMIVIGEEANPGDKSTPVIAQIKKEMLAAGSKLPVTTSAVLGWAAAKLVLAAAPHVKGSITAASMLKALNGLRDVSTDGAIHAFSAIGLKNPADTRLFNHYVIDYVVENGALKPASGFVDLTPVLDAPSS